jgi:hypothetical protein
VPFNQNEVMRVQRPWNMRRAGAAALLWLVFLGVAGGQRSGDWKTGTAFRRQMDSGVSIAWSERPLREALTGLSQSLGTAIFLDRRLNPDRTMALTVQDQPLQLLLAKIADAAEGGVTTVGPVIYFGPADCAGRLPTVAATRRQEASQLPGEAKARLLRQEALQWNALAQPRDLLDDLAQRAGVTVANPDLLPHDLWPAADLPPLPWTDRLSLLLAGFSLTFEIGDQGRSVRLMAMPNLAVLEKAYTPRGIAADTAAQLRRIVPEAKIRVEQGKILVAASQEDHDKVERLLAGQSVRTTKKAKGGPPEKRYSLAVENQPAGAVVRTLATQLGKELKTIPPFLPS